MIPFRVRFQPGTPAYSQVVHAAKKSLLGRQMRPGDKFPSVRELSQAVKINPNTAHKVIAQLVSEGWLEVRPGIGTVVCEEPFGSARDRQALLEGSVEKLVVEAKRVSVGLEEVVDAVREHWRALTPAENQETVPLTAEQEAP